MPERKLHEIFVVLIVSRISYALSAWCGFLTGQQINRIDVFLVKYDVFTARCYASAVLAMALCLSVRPSVRHKSESY